MGLIEDANIKYSEVAENGNKLWIVTDLKNKVDLYRDKIHISKD